MFEFELRKELNPQMKKALDNFQRKNTNTSMELNTGRPSQFKNYTAEAKSLSSFANSVKSTIYDIATVHFRASADSTLEESNKLLRSANYAKSQIKNARNTLNIILSKAEPALGSYQAKFKTLLTPSGSAGEAAIESELRNLIRTQDLDKSINLIKESPAIMAAVSKAPAILSGLSETAHKSIVTEYLNHSAPKEFAEYNEIMEAVESAGLAIKYLEDEANNLIDFKSAEKIESRKFEIV